MEKTVFLEHFRQAHRWAVEFATEYVIQDLPDQTIFRVYPNQSFDENAIVGVETVYPQDFLPPGRYLLMNEKDTADYLWRDGSVPEWIDIHVQSEDGSRTHVALDCCGRFTGDDQRLYRYRGGYPPFLIQSPPLPPEWVSLEVSGKFDLHWMEETRSWRKRLSRFLKRIAGHGERG
jgi:hypothetical protein